MIYIIILLSNLSSIHNEVHQVHNLHCFADSIDIKLSLDIENNLLNVSITNYNSNSIYFDPSFVNAEIIMDKGTQIEGYKFSHDPTYVRQPKYTNITQVEPDSTFNYNISLLNYPWVDFTLLNTYSFDFYYAEDQVVFDKSTLFSSYYSNIDSRNKYYIYLNFSIIQIENF